MKPRRSYKTLWLQEQGRCKAAEHRADIMRRLLQRVRIALAPTGEKIISGYQLDHGSIQLTPHDYVCVEAFFDVSRQFYDDGVPFGPVAMTWRDRPIVEVR